MAKSNTKCSGKCFWTRSLLWKLQQSLTFRPTWHEEWRWKRSKFPTNRPKKKVVHANKQTRKDIQWTARLFSHIQHKNYNDKAIGSAAKSYVVLASRLISNWRRARTAKQGMPMCVCVRVPMILCSKPAAPTYPVGWHFFLCLAYRPVCLVHAWGIARLECERRRGQNIPKQIFSLKSSVQWCNQHKNVQFSLFAPLGPSRFHVFTKKKVFRPPMFPAKLVRGSGWGEELFRRYTGQRMFVNGGKASKTPFHYNVWIPPRVLSNSWQNVTLHFLCRFFIRQGERV